VVAAADRILVGLAALEVLELAGMAEVVQQTPLEVMAQTDEVVVEVAHEAVRPMVATAALA
jgi:hypothetical protein